MSTSFAILTIVGIILISLAVSAISYNRQQAIAVRKKKLNSLHKQMVELSEYRNLLLKIDPTYDLICFLQRNILYALRNALELAPSDTDLNQQLQTQSANMEHYESGKRDNNLKPFFVTDGELNAAQILMSQLLKTLELKKNNNQLSASQHAHFVTHIHNIRSELEIESHLAQANNYAQKRDMVMYQLHLKKARDALKKAPLDSDVKNQKVKELTELLNESKKGGRIFSSGSDQPSAQIK